MEQTNDVTFFSNFTTFNETIPAGQPALYNKTVPVTTLEWDVLAEDTRLCDPACVSVDSVKLPPPDKKLLRQNRQQRHNQKEEQL